MNGAEAYNVWGSLAHKLSDESYRAEYVSLSLNIHISRNEIILIPACLSLRLALDLTEVFFQIVHTRLPLLNPAQFRYRLKYALMGPNTPLGSNGMLAPGMSSPLTPQNGHSRNGHDQKPLHPASVIFLQSYTLLLTSAL